MERMVSEKTNTCACHFFAHDASVRERLGTNIADAKLLPILAWAWHDTCMCHFFAQTSSHTCKYHANGHGMIIAYTHAKLLPRLLGMILACVSVGIGLARPCKYHAILAWSLAKLLPRLLGTIIAWSLVKLLPGFTGLPYALVRMGKNLTGQKLDTKNPRPNGPGVSGLPPGPQ